jgi:hypothetical protein
MYYETRLFIEKKPTMQYIENELKKFGLKTHSNVI